MKKIVILGAAMLALSTSAMADDKSFVIKVGGFGATGLWLFDKDKQPGADSSDATKSSKNELSALGYGVAGGVGYQLMDNLSVGIDAAYFMGQKWTYTTPAEKDDKGAQTAPALDTTFNLSGPAAFVAATFDLPLGDSFGVFFNAGLGMSYVTVDHTGQKADNKPTDAAVPDDAAKYTYAAKARLAWKVGLGFSVNLSDSLALDISGTYTYFGKPENADIADATDQAKATTLKQEFNSFNTVAVNAQVRYSM